MPITASTGHVLLRDLFYTAIDTLISSAANELSIHEAKYTKKANIKTLSTTFISVIKLMICLLNVELAGVQIT